MSQHSRASAPALAESMPHTEQGASFSMAVPAMWLSAELSCSLTWHHPRPSYRWFRVQPPALLFLDHASGIKSKNSFPSSRSPSSSCMFSLLFNMTSSSIEETCSQAMGHKCQQCHVTGTPHCEHGPALSHSLVCEVIYILDAVKDWSVTKAMECELCWTLGLDEICSLRRAQARDGPKPKALLILTQMTGISECMRQSLTEPALEPSQVADTMQEIKSSRRKRTEFIHG